MTKPDQKTTIVTPKMVYGDDFEDITKLDVSLDSFMHRMDTLCEILEEKAGFTAEGARVALTGAQFKSDVKKLNRNSSDLVYDLTEEAAQWAREELKQIRNHEAKNRLLREKRDKYKTPILDDDNSVGRAELSDLAISLLEVVEKPGETLTLLLAELLNVDRHRQALNENDTHEFKMAAQIVAQNPKIKSKDLAAMVGKSEPSISRWRNHPDYKDSFEKKVERFKKILSILEAQESNNSE